MSVTSDIKAALVADCEAITTGNGFNNTVGEVRTDPIDPGALTLPALVIEGLADGESDPASFANRQGQAAQRFRVVGYIRGTEASTSLETFVDDLRNAVERSASNLAGALAGGDEKVLWAVVAQWEEDEGSPRLKNERHRFNAVVEVQYYYVRGSL